MQQMLREMRPKVFENIIAGISLYRPGPMEFIPQYNRRLHGEEEPEYRHEKLEPILEETYGILVYQEQIMQVAGELFGYDLGEADLMRRAVSKKKQKALMEHKAIFIERGPENGIDAETAEKIFDDIEFFANYGFNKSHASDYAVITVQTAYLKCHYPEEYMTALLSVQRDDSAKLATFLEECRRLSIPILPPDVNTSETDFTIQTDPETGQRGIRFGLGAIKNASENSLHHLVDARGEDGPFTDLVDLCRRVDLRNVGRRTIESLIKVGAMVAFGERGSLLNALDRIMSYSTNYFKDKEVGQMSMFGEATGLQDNTLSPLPDGSMYSTREMLGWEKELIGLYISGRPVDRYRNELAQTRSYDVQEVKQKPEVYNEREIMIAGEIVTMRRIYTRNNDPMAVLQVEDWHDSAGSVEVVVFPRTWRRVLELIETEDMRDLVEGEVIQVFGKFDTSRGNPQIIAEKITQNFEIIESIGDLSAQNGDLPAWIENEAHIDDDWAYADAPVTLPPPPEEAPPIWEQDDEFYDEETGEVTAPAPEPEAEGQTIVAPASQGATGEHTPSIEPQIAPGANEPEIPAHLLLESELPDPVWLCIYFQRSEDDARDRRRLVRLHGLLVSYPGNDRFTIVVEGPDKTERLEFPNHTTGYCEELLNDLCSVVGTEDNIEIFHA
jgi:DNA polymerase-3 subunit alpha